MRTIQGYSPFYKLAHNSTGLRAKLLLYTIKIYNICKNIQDFLSKPSNHLTCTQHKDSDVDIYAQVRDTFYFIVI